MSPIVGVSMSSSSHICQAQSRVRYALAYKLFKIYEFAVLGVQSLSTV